MADNPRMGVCLDTSFLITLCSQKRENHDVANGFDEGSAIFSDPELPLNYQA